MKKLELISPICFCLGALCFLTAAVFLLLSSVPIVGTVMLSVGMTSLACTVILTRSYVKSCSSLKKEKNTYVKGIENEVEAKAEVKIYRRELRKMTKVKK